MRLDFKIWAGTSLVVHWLRFCAPKAEGLGLFPDQGTRSHIVQLPGSSLQTEEEAGLP